MPTKTEDVVRDEARDLLNFTKTSYAECGVGQLTTFNQLGFPGVADKPDGWYLPTDTAAVAIILETKNSDIDITKSSCTAELFKNIDIAATRYEKVIGILYNGVDVLVYKDKALVDLKKELFTKEYYLKLYTKDTIDKSLIFGLTEKINNNLHSNFGINNLYHRMVFTACALVAQRFSPTCLVKGMDWATMHMAILSTIRKAYKPALAQNLKLDLLGEQFSLIHCNFTENQTAIDGFIECIDQISRSINSDYWNGEDVMAIFFNEFTRYKGKAEQGQVFTPDHVTSLIYRITGTCYKDNVLDACCGSGSFLTKAMSYMIGEVGGIFNEPAVKAIKEQRLYGIEFSKELYALACANMLIHKDGKTNITQDDSRTPAAGAWIKSKGITKVLMNPPYENKFGCLTIIENVLTNVADGAICAFILPDNKLTTTKGFAKKILAKHTLQKIIKLPDVFAGMAGVATSVFIFKAHDPQGEKEIFSCWIKEDGLETVKNKGRMDVKGRWPAIEDKWVEIIYKQSGDDSIQWIKPTEPLMYTVQEGPTVISDYDFRKTVLDYFLFSNPDATSHILVKEQNGVILSNSVALLAFLAESGPSKLIQALDTTTWREFLIKDYLNVECSKYSDPSKFKTGNVPYIARTAFNNGVVSKIDTDAILYPGNCITVGAESAKAFYQPLPFLTGNKVYRLYANDNWRLTKNIGLFLAAVLNKEGEKYNYTNAWVSDKIKETVIRLPAVTNADGTFSPDWNYMAEYIANIEKSLGQSLSLAGEEEPSIVAG